MTPTINPEALERAVQAYARAQDMGHNHHDALYSALTSALPEKTVSTISGVPDAWANPDNPDDVVSASKLDSLRNHNGAPGKKLAERYTKALYAAPAAAGVPDGVWEALQRLIENAATLGPASQEDAILVARYRRHLVAAQPQAEQQGVADANSPWQLKAAEWLESQAETQEESNLKWPKHAQVYEAWRRRPEEYRHLALVLRLELRAALAARQPGGGPVAFVPVHPSIGPLWGDTYPAGSSGDGRPARYERRPLYTAPPATVDLGKFRALTERWRSYEGGGCTGVRRTCADELDTLIDSKAVHHE